MKDELNKINNLIYILTHGPARDLHPRLGHETCIRDLDTRLAYETWTRDLHTRLGHETCIRDLHPRLASEPSNDLHSKL